MLAIAGVVVFLSAGQILFKLAAQQIAGTPFFWQGLLKLSLLPVFSLGVFLYGLATIVWIWALRDLQLGITYPLIALTFVMVPLASHFVFGETVGFRNILGGLLIVLGVWVSVGGWK
jgi:drug/metabolite transporter (DMT)-like permease